MTDPDVHSLIGAYVLDAVDDLERAAFDRHLRECSSCRAEVAELREASARLGADAWSVPPPTLRDNVRSAIRSVPQLPPATPVPPTASGRAAVPSAASGGASVPSAAPRRRLLVGAAAVLLAVGGAATAVYAIQDQRVRREHARAEAALTAEARIRTVLAAPDLVLKEGPVTGGGRVTVATSRLHDAGVIMLAAGAAPAGGRVYQLWTIRSRVPVPEGTLAPGQTASVQIVEGVTAASDVGVSVEPPGGSATPTMPLVADVKT
jgi:anti-sigma-K factor RskA